MRAGSLEGGGTPLPRDDSGSRRESPLTSAKDAIRIPDLWDYYGLPCYPATSCCSPFRLENKPSFSVFKQGRRWNDFGTDEGGDAVDFIAKVEKLDKRAAAKRLIELHRGGLACRNGTYAAVHADPRDDYSAEAREEKKRKRASWPVLRELLGDERQRLAELRHLDRGAIDLACARGVLLSIDTQNDGAAWVVVDKLCVNGQARRLDGQNWRRLPGEPKAWTLPGSIASWPVGLANADLFDDILMVEGGPDLLAAHQLVIEGGAVGRVAPVSMLGASLRMAELTIEKFRNRRVSLCPHVDANGHGREAAKRWAIQLRPVAMSIWWIDLSGLRRADGSPVKDLCDLMSRGPGGHDVNAEAIARFATSLRDGGAA